MTAEGGSRWVRKPSPTRTRSSCSPSCSSAGRSSSGSRLQLVPHTGRELALRRDRPDRPVQRLLHHDGPALVGDRGVGPADLRDRTRRRWSSSAPARSDCAPPITSSSAASRTSSSSSAATSPARRRGCRSGSSRRSTSTRWRSRSGSRACGSSPARALGRAPHHAQRLPPARARRSGHGGVRAQRRAAAGLGVADCRVVDRDDLSRLIPDMRGDDLAGGLFGPSDGYIDGHAYCDALPPAITRPRRPRPPGHRARRLRRPARRPDTGSGRRRGDARLRRSWSTPPAAGRVASATSWVRRSRSCRSGTRRWSRTSPRRSPYVMPSVMDYVPSSGGFGAYFRDEGPRPAHRRAAHGGGHPRHRRSGRRAAGTRANEYIELVAERLAHRLPGLDDMRLGDVWAGIYPMRPDGKPVVGPHPGRRVGGHGRRRRRVRAPVVAGARTDRRGLDRRRGADDDPGAPSRSGRRRRAGPSGAGPRRPSCYHPLDLQSA